VVPELWERRIGSNALLRWLTAFIGDILLGIGSRWADGCTSGHGISGTLQLVVSSWIAAICFFIGGVLTAIAMTLLSLPNPILWGVVAGTLNFVQYLGAAFSLIIISVVSLLTFDAWSHIILPPVIFLALTVIEGQFVAPSILGRRLTLNPLMVLLSILFWGVDMGNRRGRLRERWQ
jgi:predicted PurR-regulated permease PerM